MIQMLLRRAHELGKCRATLEVCMRHIPIAHQQLCLHPSLTYSAVHVHVKAHTDLSQAVGPSRVNAVSSNFSGNQLLCASQKQTFD